MILSQNLKDNKVVLIINTLILIFVLTLKFGGNTAAFYQALGYSIFWIPIWALIGWVFSSIVIISILNIVNPDNNIEFSWIDKLNIGLLLGWFVGIFWSF